MGKGIVDELKKEFDITDEWMSFEIHPETPREGILLSKRFGEDGMKMMKKSLKAAGAPYGMEFGDLVLLSNSRMALEASEYAKDNGRFDKFHEAVFHSYFTDGKDIGNINIILEIGESSGLDRDSLRSSLEKHTFTKKLDECARNADMLRINSTPTFIINDEHKIVGAQPIEVFRKLFRALK